jgi:hypothetical protein
MSEKDIVAWLDSLGCEELKKRMKAIDTDPAFDQFLRGVFGEEGEVCGPARRIKCVLDPGFLINQQGVVETISPQAPPGINVGLAIKEFKPPAGEGVDPPAHLEWLVKSRAPYEVIFAAMPMAASLVQSRGWISLRCLRGDLSRDAGQRRVYFANLRRKVQDFLQERRVNELEKAIVCDTPEAEGDDGLSWKPYYVKFGHRGRALLAILMWFFEKGLSPPEWLHAFKQIPALHKGLSSSYGGCGQLQGPVEQPGARAKSLLFHCSCFPWAP